MNTWINSYKITTVQSKQTTRTLESIQEELTVFDCTNFIINNQQRFDPEPRDLLQASISILVNSNCRNRPSQFSARENGYTGSRLINLRIREGWRVGQQHWWVNYLQEFLTNPNPRTPLTTLSQYSANNISDYWANLVLALPSLLQPQDHINEYRLVHKVEDVYDFRNRKGCQHNDRGHSPRFIVTSRGFLQSTYIRDWERATDLDCGFYVCGRLLELRPRDMDCLLRKKPRTNRLGVRHTCARSLNRLMTSVKVVTGF